MSPKKNGLGEDNILTTPAYIVPKTMLCAALDIFQREADVFSG